MEWDRKAITAILSAITPPLLAITVAVTVAFTLATTGTGLASTCSIYVATTGSDSNSGTQAHPYATITKAASVAVPGNVICVGPGTYNGGFITNASGTAGSPITYLSTTLQGAIISGISVGSTTAVWQDQGSYTVIQGFTVTGTTAQLGLYHTHGGNEIIQNNVVHDIVTDPTTYALYSGNGQGGAGIDADDYLGSYGGGGENGTITDNLVYNVGQAGHTDSTIQGIYMVQSGTVSNNVVHDITSCGIITWHGGSHINIVNNTIVNASDCGIILGADNGDPRTADFNNVGNNIVSYSGGGGGGTGDAIVEQGQTGTHNTYYNNNVFNSATISLQNSLTATGTQTGNPNLASTIDFHLTINSPGKGNGSATNAPPFDYDGNPRPTAGRYDIGAYQFTKTTCACQF